MAGPAPGDWTGITDPASAHAVFRRWLFEAALPFWAGPGHDAAAGGAREHLHADGRPAARAWTRMRVQARQIYCFSQAALAGWPDGERLARRGYRFITRSGERPDGGWVRRVTPDGAGVVDPSVDLYDQAFVLFALAWYARLTGSDEPLGRARRTLGWIETHMAAGTGGFHNVMPLEAGPRQQNPHMHLLEAALALLDVSGAAAWRRLAEDLVSLFHRHLFDRETGSLGEFFADDWSPAPGDAGRVREPGHLFEWAWLLGEADRVLGARSADAAQALHRFACRHGIDRRHGLVLDAVDRDGGPVARTFRLWPQMEAIKAFASRPAENAPGDATGGTGGPARIAPLLRAVGSRFLLGCPAGTWVDRLDPDGRPAADGIPTSSFYHLVMGYAALDRLAGTGAADAG